jgi:DNA-dependent protein kinase catalytic subunit
MRKSVCLSFLQALIPWDGLREALLAGSGSADAWLRRRGTFRSSLAVSCAWGYLAGVGDRHSDNILLETATGALVPIDFGYSFGTAVVRLG